MRRPDATILLLSCLVALLPGPVSANSVTPPAEAAATTVGVPARGAFPTTTLSATLAPPNSPELRAATSTNLAVEPQTESSVPEPTSMPNFDGGLDADVNAGFVQTTYYSCVTRGTYSHCGWHIPILDASAWRPGQGADVAMRAGLVAAAVVGLLAVG